MLSLADYLAVFRERGYAWRLGCEIEADGKARYFCMLLSGGPLPDVMAWGDSEIGACAEAAREAGIE